MAKSRAWSPVEDEWLKKHNGKTSLNQLSIALRHPPSAIKKRLEELSIAPKQVPVDKATGVKHGKRPDLGGLYLRSGWEADCARYLDWCKAGRCLDVDVVFWEYEPHTFWFESIKRGNRHYMPDFKIQLARGDYRWIEVKGYLRPGDKPKLRRFKKFYPDEFDKLIAITGSQNTEAFRFFQELGVQEIWHFNEMSKIYKTVIPHWES